METLYAILITAPNGEKAVIIGKNPKNRFSSFKANMRKNVSSKIADKWEKLDKNGFTYSVLFSVPKQTYREAKEELYKILFTRDENKEILNPVWNPSYSNASQYYLYSSDGKLVKSGPSNELLDEMDFFYKKKMSKNLRVLYKGNVLSLTPLTKEEVDKEYNRRIVIYSTNGNFLCVKNSVSEVIEFTGASINTIYISLNSESGLLRGKYVIRYVKDSFIPPKITSTPNKKSGYPIVQKDLDGNIINTFDTIQKASLATKISRGRISANLRGKTGPVDKMYTFEVRSGYKPRKRGIKYPQPVVQMDRDGNIIAEFPSIKEAITTTGIQNISAVCSGRIPHSHGFIWKYKEE